MKSPRRCWSLLELLLGLTAAALLWPILWRFVIAFSEALAGRGIGQ